MYNFDNFDAFILSTNGQTIGEGECWDYVNLIWNHLGSKYWTYPPLDPTATNHGIKWGVLDPDALAANQITGLTYISNINDIKRGDIVITTGGTYGHGGYINEDFDPNDPDRRYAIYSQNYANRRSVALDFYTISGDFGGAFRYNSWNPTPPPTPTPSYKLTSFPFVLLAERLRNDDNLLY